MQQHEFDDDPCRHALAKQVLDGCEREGLRVWQQFGSAYVGRSARGRLVEAPRNWQRLVEALSFEIACLLDWDCGWGCTVERAPGTNCLIYKPERWHNAMVRPCLDRADSRTEAAPTSICTGYRAARGPL
jgi:hypothetical protein